jgi:hypothetical protein
MNYFMIGGDKREYGPVDAELIRQWVREGRANGETLLRAENETEWKPLRTFADFQTEFGAPPLAGAATPPEFFEGPHDVPVRVGHAFARAWHLVGQHFGVIAAATLMVWMAFTAMLYAPCFGVLAMIFYGPLFGGLYMLFLKLIREGEASPGDIFILTRDSALPLMMTGLVGIILTEIATVCCCVVPGIYLQIAWLFSLPLVADRGLGFWEALEASRRAATRHWFKLFALFVLSLLPFMVFHVYLMVRESADVSPYLEKLIMVIRDAMATGNAPNQAEVQKIATEIDAVQRSYGLWTLVRQALLLISLPFGIGSLAFVYEDLFGRKK